MKRMLFIAALVLLAGTAQAQTGEWIVDQNGCKAWNSNPQPGETMTWSGKCVKGFAEGKGTQKWFKNGQPSDEYTGAMRGGKRHGKGTCIWASGQRYEGDWVDNDAHGKGTLTFANGNRYQGDFVGGSSNGEGTFTWANGDRHTGTYVNGSRKGFGVRKEGGEVRRGCWDNNKFTPASSAKECTTEPKAATVKVDQTLHNGDRYVGEVLGGKKHGKGTYLWANGDRYEGEWANDMMHGKGIFTWPDGDRHEGEWVNDKKRGFGVRKEGAKVHVGCWNGTEYTPANSPAECGSSAAANPPATPPDSEAETEAKHFVTGVASWRLAARHCRWTPEMIGYLNKIEPEMYAYMVSKGHTQQRLDSYKSYGKDIAERAYNAGPEAFCSDMTKRFSAIQKDAEPNTSPPGQPCPNGTASNGRCLGASAPAAAPPESGASWLQNLRAEMSRCQTKNAISKAICINKAKTRYCPANAYDVKECENLQPNPTVGG